MLKFLVLDNIISDFFYELDIGKRFELLGLEPSEQDMTVCVEVPETHILYKNGVRRIIYKFGYETKGYYEDDKKVRCFTHLFVDLSLFKRIVIGKVQLEISAYDISVLWRGDEVPEYENFALVHNANVVYKINMSKEKFVYSYILAFYGYECFLSAIISKAKLTSYCSVFYINLLDLEDKQIYKYLSLLFTLGKNYFGDRYSSKDSDLSLDVYCIDDKSSRLLEYKLKLVVNYIIELSREKGNTDCVFRNIRLRQEKVYWKDKYGVEHKDNSFIEPKFEVIVNELTKYGFKYI